jgi:hypothetical protein
VSNTIDPATPIQDSQKWAPSFTGSQILEIQAIGVSIMFLARTILEEYAEEGLMKLQHTSMAANNACANEKIFKFFQTGKLPGMLWLNREVMRRYANQ